MAKNILDVQKVLFEFIQEFCLVQILRLLQLKPDHQFITFLLTITNTRAVAEVEPRRSIPFWEESPKSHLTDHSDGKISLIFSFFISRSCSLQVLLCWCRVTEVKLKYTVINRQQYYRKPDTHWNRPL